ncbi:MAG TPA: flagellar motor switch protein FliN [Anaerolineales bacterium]|nr:flagellar motor switch protein FliN [Anaerolineales bacterium]HRF47125.1 flagellar motor switch protein FliN [Anaerolineales bacterium]
MSDTVNAPDVRAASFAPINADLSAGAPNGLDLLMDVPLRISVELGRTKLSVREVLDLQNGAVVELDRMAGDAVDVLVNDKLMARGEVVVVDDKFGIRITEILTPSKKA